MWGIKGPAPLLGLQTAVYRKAFKANPRQSTSENLQYNFEQKSELLSETVKINWKNSSETLYFINKNYQCVTLTFEEIQPVNLNIIETQNLELEQHLDIELRISLCDLDLQGELIVNLDYIKI